MIREICDNKSPPTIVSDGNAITVELQNAVGLIQQILEAQYSVLSTGKFVNTYFYMSFVYVFHSVLEFYRLLSMWW